MGKNVNCIQRSAFVGALLVAVLVGLQLRAGSAQAAVPHACSWSVVSSPNVWFDGNKLTGVAAISARDVWSVGYDFPDGGSKTTITEHWNGSQWSVVNSPNPGSSELFAVAAVATNDVWAVGDTSTTALIEHWDGTSWNVVSSPAPGSLRGVTVISANDIWAVGRGPNGTLTEHWNGTSWSTVPSPAQGAFSSVTAISPTNVWAVGSYYFNRTLIAHWDGTSWSVVSSPNGPLKNNTLTGVVAISANDIWAVGYDDDLTTLYRVVSQALIEHWDGTSWSIVASPSPMNTYLMGVAAVSAKNIWAVGLTGYQTVTEQWNGSQWSLVSSPNPGQYDNNLNGVARIPHTTDVWAVGSYIDNGSSQVTLTELLSC